MSKKGLQDLTKIILELNEEYTEGLDKIQKAIGRVTDSCFNLLDFETLSSVVVGGCVGYLKDISTDLGRCRVRWFKPITNLWR